MTALLLPPRTQPASEAAAARQPLNPLDQALLCVDRSIRGMGYPGFETQMLVRLAEHIDADRLRQAIERLSRRRPAITARLVDDDSAGAAPPYWRMTGELATLHEIDLPSAESDAVLACAEELLSRSHDPALHAPVRFYLLRRRSGGDVLLLQYNHVLMDQSGSVALLRELNQFCSPSSVLDETPHLEPPNVVSRWLREIPRQGRHDAVEACVALQGRTLRGRAALLGKAEEDKPRRARLRIATRTIGPELTRGIQESSRQTCGLPSLSMSVLACAFRAIREFGPQQRNADRNYIVGIGLDMNLRRDASALLQNLLAVVSIFARPDELTDRDALVRILSRQIRDRLEAKMDVAVLRLVNAFQRKPRHIRWVIDHLLRWTHSLWYAYFGSLDSVGREFCSVPIEHVNYVGPTWSPLGLSLLANQYQGRLFLQATYDPDLVDTPLAHAFLDFVLDDLAEFAAARGAN